MKGIFIVLALVACASAVINLDQQWADFKTKFGKEYTKEEDTRRYKIFVSNLVQITAHNKKFDKGEVTFKMGVNKFTDMLLEETRYLRGAKHIPIKKAGVPMFKAQPGVVAPDTVDWREKGYVTPVKDQQQCGSCWAFSSTGSLEGQNFAKTGQLISLSEQNLVDCVSGSSCDGGWMTDAFQYVIDNGGIDTEDSYPYEAVDDTCRYDKSNIGGVCSSYKTIAFGDEDSLLDATATIGPISVAIDASHMSFQSYSSGVYYEEACSELVLDHGVLVAGYGTEAGVEYWLVKNSWGTSWGEAGYIKMSRNANNNCGIASEAAYPLV